MPKTQRPYLTILVLLGLLGSAGCAQNPATNVPSPIPSLIPLVQVSGGTFPMGVDRAAPTRDYDEWPVHQVTVGDFAIGKTDVTQAQWQVVMGDNPSDNRGPDLPVDSVTWYQAIAFCNRLSLKEGLTPVYRDYGAWADGTMRLDFADPTANGYRLPTEAEWEYAARGGALNKGSRYAGGDDAAAVAWYRDDSGDHSHPVGQKAPNELGLYDMSGDVLQWCWDGYAFDSYRTNSPGDPCLSYQNARVARGSAWWNRAESLRVTIRNGFNAGRAYNFVGFRVARGANPDLAPKWPVASQAQYLKQFSTEITQFPGAPAVVPDHMILPPSPAAPLRNVVTAEVRPFAGAPTLFINGKPDTGLMLWRDEPDKAAQEIADFHTAGINLIQTDMPLDWAWQADGTVNSARIDGEMQSILHANPDALVLFRIHVNCPGWWTAANPTHHNVGYSPGPDKYGHGDWEIPTFADPAWQKAAAAGAQGEVQYLEEHYGDHVIGYVICAGDTGEWSPGWLNGGEYDFSPPQRDAFRKWMNDPTVNVPRDRLRDGRPNFFDDPAKDALLGNYYQFQSEAETDALLYLARQFRVTLDSLHRKRILGAFFGYSNAMYFRMGTHDLDQVLKSPDIDFIASLSWYAWRGPGGLYFGTSTPASIRLNGKLLYNEEDSATPLSKQVKPGMGNRYGPPDFGTTQNLSVHKIVGAWLEGGTDWYMDWLDENWYENPDLLKTIGATQKLLTSELGQDRSSTAQIAVFGSEKAVQFIRPNDANLDRWHSDNREPLARLGATFDFYDIADLDLALKSHQYKLLVFLEVPEINPARLPPGVSVLWTYLPGYSATAASRSIGFPIQTLPRDQHNPELDPAAGPAEGSGAVAFTPNIWRKGSTYWAPVTPLTLADLQQVAAAAGVHFYTAPGDQILANHSLLLIHSASAGTKQFSLPERCNVTDAYTGEVVARNADAFSANLKFGETRVWKTEPVAAP